MPKKAQTEKTNLATQSVADAKVSRVITKSPQFFSIYANDVQVQTGPWDMRLVLGEIAVPRTPDDPATSVSVIELGELRISPQLAKRLAMIMLEQLKKYEENFGAIPGPRQ